MVFSVSFLCPLRRHGAAFPKTEGDWKEITFRVPMSLEPADRSVGIMYDSWDVDGDITDDDGIEFTKDKPADHPFQELWIDSLYTFTTVGNKNIEVKISTSNADDTLYNSMITINGRGAYITDHPQIFAKAFEVKDSMYLSAAGAGTLPLTWQWFKDTVAMDTSGTAIPQLTPLTGKIEPFLIIPVLDFSDSGSYYCGVYNIYGTDTSDATLIRVIPQPPDSTWPYISFASKTSLGGENINGSIAIQLSRPYTEVVTVKVKTGASSSATQNLDFSFIDTLINFDPSETIKNVTIAVTDDKVNEPNETVVLELVSAQNGILGTIIQNDTTLDSTLLTHTYSIVDNDESNVQFLFETASIG